MSGTEQHSSRQRKYASLPLPLLLFRFIFRSFYFYRWLISMISNALSCTHTHSHTPYACTNAAHSNRGKTHRKTNTKIETFPVDRMRQISLKSFTVNFFECHTIAALRIILLVETCVVCTKRIMLHLSLQRRRSDIYFQRWYISFMTERSQSFHHNKVVGVWSIIHLVDRMRPSEKNSMHNFVSLLALASRSLSCSSSTLNAFNTFDSLNHTFSFLKIDLILILMQQQQQHSICVHWILSFYSEITISNCIHGRHVSHQIFLIFFHLLCSERSMN